MGWRLRGLAGFCWLAACCVAGVEIGGTTRAESPTLCVHDLALEVAPDLPCVWPIGMTPHVVALQSAAGPASYRRELVVIDEHTGTQWDAPAHFVPPPDSGLPGAGPMGALTGDRVPAWQFCGEACVIDVRAHRDEAAAGSSFLIQPKVVRDWERAHRPLGPGDVVLFHSGYSDAYYRPFPAGERFVAAALRKDTPGWPAPTPDTMTYLADRGVTTLGLDGASMGPLPDLAAATHQAGGARGMVWVECATNLGSLPTTGAFFALLAAKHAGGSGSECRPLAVTDPQLAPRLIAAARAHRVVDLSVTLAENLPVTWPGARPGDGASRYVSKTLNAFDPARGPYFAMGHLLDGQVGTHLVPPSFSLVAPANATAAASAMEAVPVAAQMPLALLVGEAHVVDVRSLVGTTEAARWPASPSISDKQLADHERQVRPFRAGEVVVFYSGFVDRYFAPFPAAPALEPLLAAPLAGQAEGWPAPTPAAVEYLAERGVRVIATDGPTLGGAGADQAHAIYETAARRGVWPLEFLTGVSEIASRRAVLVFAPIKLGRASGGYGRVLALYDQE